MPTPNLPVIIPAAAFYILHVRLGRQPRFNTGEPLARGWLAMEAEHG